MKTNRQRIVPILAGLSLLFMLPAITFAAETKSKTDNATQARLGVGVTSLPEVLKSHLPTVIDDGRGVLVSEVAKGSPADIAGLKPHDVLVRYDDQDLYSPEQLVKRVRNDEPDKEIEVQYVRAGELRTTKVKLGEQTSQKPVYSEWPGMVGRFNFPFSPLRPEFWTEAQDELGTGTEWTSFESLTLQKEADGTYLVRITYQDTGGNSISKEFTGTRQQIRDAINDDNDLPQSRKDQLLRSLDDRGRQPLQRMPWERWDREIFQWPNVDF